MQQDRGKIRYPEVFGVCYKQECEGDQPACKISGDHHLPPRKSVDKCAGDRRHYRKRDQSRDKEQPGGSRRCVRNVTHQAQPGDEIEPVAEFRDELSGQQIAEIAVSPDQLSVGQRLHCYRMWL